MKSKGIVYLLLDISNRSKITFRVGKTKNIDLSRPKSQQVYLPFKTEMFIFHSSDYENLETKIHRKLKPNKINGDWYSCHISEVIDEIINEESVFKVDFPSLFSLFSGITNIT